VGAVQAHCYSGNVALKIEPETSESVARKPLNHKGDLPYKLYFETKNALRNPNLSSIS
jgi:hypothetical protein